MLRLDTGIDAVSGDGLGQVFVRQAIELTAGNSLIGAVENIQLLGDGYGGVLMVTGDHHRADARVAALVDGVPHLGTHGIDHARQADEAQLPLQIFGGNILRQRIPPVSHGGGQHPQGTVGHILVIPQNGLPLLLCHGVYLPVFHISGAQAQHLVGRSLGVLQEAVVCPVDCGHHLPAGIKGGFRHTGLLLLQSRLVKARGGCEVHQSGLRRLPLCPLLCPRGVIAQRHSRGQQFPGSGVLHHGHLVLGEGTGLIGADDLGTAQSLHCRQAADHRSALAHIGDADGQHHRYHRGKALGDGGHSQRHSHHEGVEDGREGIIPFHQQVEDEDEHADAQHQIGQSFAQLVQLALQGRLLLLRAGQHPGDLAHFGVHARGGNNGAAPAIDYG